MGHYHRIEITCDWPECYARIESFGSKLTEARAKAARHGWKNLFTEFDFCGTPEQADAYDWDGKKILAGHANREDHMPIVKAAGKGRITVACVCGWKYPGEYSWDHGTTYRGGAKYRWEHQHMREVLAAEKAASASPPTKEEPS